jgi:hypothetical protein
MPPLLRPSLLVQIRCLFVLPSIRLVLSYSLVVPAMDQYVLLVHYTSLWQAQQG